MYDLSATARQLQSFCDRQGWRSCFIGGIAVQRWGEPRVTRDVDLTLLAGFGGEDPIIDALLGAWPARIADAREFARRHRVVLLGTLAGVGIDVSLGALPFEENVVSRATAFSFGPWPRNPGMLGRGSGGILRLFASRPLDIADQLRPLAEIKDPAIHRTLARLRRLAAPQA